MNFQRVLDGIAATLKPELGQSGKVADYIPALARVPADRFGMALRTAKGEEFSTGEADMAFSIQSISKLFSLTLAMRALGETLWERIGREASGDPFNSLLLLEKEEGKPRNPFINAGAIAVADRLVSCGDGLGAILAFLSSLTGETIEVNEEVALSEAGAGHRNAALANLMKSFRQIDNDVADVLHVYFRQCAIEMTCRQVARAGAYLAREGVHTRQQTQVLSERQTRRVNALMLTCGTYDAAGEFAFRIGLPCKSGVGGGMLAIVPGELSLCVWSPALDESGNSHIGMRALELFVAETGLTVF